MAWRKTVAWVGIALAAGAAVVIVTGCLVIRSRAFHGYVLAQLEKQASQATGAEVRIQDFALHLPALAADVYGITVRGDQPASAHPLAQADELMVRLKIVSVLQKKVDLNEIVLRHPVVNLQVRKDGTTNLPTPPKSTNNTSTNPFDLGIQHVLLEHGEVFYDDVKTPLDADLHDLELEIKSNLAGKGYNGSLSYRNGRVQYGEMKPLPHNLTAGFNATPSEFRLKPLVLTVASSTIRLEGQVENYSQPSASGSYNILIHPQDAGSAIKSTAIPSGEVTLSGSLRYQQQPNVPAIRALTLDGHLNGRELAVNTPDLRAVVQNVRGAFELVNGNLNVRGLEADLLGGHVAANATIEHLDSNTMAKLHASVQAISLTAANAALRSANLDPMPLRGQVSGTADADWSGNIKNIKADRRAHV